jgi:DNA-binding transcriptional LysR family regulator
VVETGSFSKASKIVYLSQPAVSLQIRSLESSLGVCLFNRSTKDYVLTESGKTLYNYAKKIIDLCGEAAQSLCDIDNLAKGSLRVRADTAVGEYWLLSQLACFKGIYPCIDVSLKIANSMEIIEDVMRGKVEIGIVAINPERDELICKQILCDKLVVIIPLEHPWVSVDKISLEQLKEEPFLMRTEGSGIRMAIEKQLKEVGIAEADLNVGMWFGNTEAIKKGVISGIGFSIVPQMAVENELRLGILKKITIEGISLSINFYIVYNSDRFRSRIPEALLEYLLE